MRFKIDENLPIEVAELLRKTGYDTHTVYDEKIAGGDDDSLLRICTDEERVLVTIDLDFSQVLLYPPSKQKGVVILRYKNQGKTYLLHHFKSLIPHFAENPMEGQFRIVTEKKIRIKE